MFLLLILSAVAVPHMAHSLRSRNKSTVQYANGEIVDVEFATGWLRAKVNSTVQTGVRVSYDAGGYELIPSADLESRVRRTTNGRGKKRENETPINTASKRAVPQSASGVVSTTGTDISFGMDLLDAAPNLSLISCLALSRT